MVPDRAHRGLSRSPTRQSAKPAAVGHSHSFVALVMRRPGRKEHHGPDGTGVQWTSRATTRTRTLAILVALSLQVVLAPTPAYAATDYILMSRSALLARPVSGTARNVPDGSHTVVVRAPGASDHPPSHWPTCIS
jgi:hypothetical protein